MAVEAETVMPRKIVVAAARIQAAAPAKLARIPAARTDRRLKDRRRKRPRLNLQRPNLRRNKQSKIFRTFSIKLVAMNDSLGEYGLMITYLFML